MAGWTDGEPIGLCLALDALELQAVANVLGRVLDQRLSVVLSSGRARWW